MTEWGLYDTGHGFLCTNFLNFNQKRVSYPEFFNFSLVHKIWQELADLCDKYNLNWCRVTYDPGKV